MNSGPQEKQYVLYSIAQLETGKQAASPSAQEYKNKVQNSHSKSSSSLQLRVHHCFHLGTDSIGFRGRTRLGMARTMNGIF